jgi:hypothetical protein
MNKLGYGLLVIDGHRIGVHRWILGEFRGEPLAQDEEAMHGCDNPPCCSTNPGHLRVGTHAENMEDMRSKGRGVSPVSLANSVKTHCIRGHELAGENLVIEKSGKRQCRICNRIRYHAYLDRKRKAAQAS